MAALGAYLAIVKPKFCSPAGAATLATLGVALLNAAGFSPRASAQTGLFLDPDLLSIDFYEMTGGREWTRFDQSVFSTKLQRLPALNASSYDHQGSSAGEWYDLYTSDSLGNYRADGNFLTIDVRFDFWDIAGNIDAIHLNWGGAEPGTDYATQVTRVIYGGPIDTLAQPSWTPRALGASDYSGTGLGATRQGTGSQYVELMSITLAFPDSFPVLSGVVTASITPDAPLGFNAGNPGGLRINNLNLTASGVFSATPSVLSGTAFGQGGTPPPPPDAVLWGDTAPRQMWDVGFGGSFTGPANLTFYYDDSLLPPGFSEETFTVFHHNGSVWEMINGVVDANANSITISTSGFSPFLLGVPEPGTTGLIILSLFAGLGIRRITRRGRR